MLEVVYDGTSYDTPTINISHLGSVQPDIDAEDDVETVVVLDAGLHSRISEIEPPGVPVPGESSGRFEFTSANTPTVQSLVDAINSITTGEWTARLVGHATGADARLSEITPGVYQLQPQVTSDEFTDSGPEFALKQMSLIEASQYTTSLLLWGTAVTRAVAGSELVVAKAHPLTSILDEGVGSGSAVASGFFTDENGNPLPEAPTPPAMTSTYTQGELIRYDEDGTPIYAVVIGYDETGTPIYGDPTTVPELPELGLPLYITPSLLNSRRAINFEYIYFAGGSEGPVPTIQDWADAIALTEQEDVYGIVIGSGHPAVIGMALSSAKRASSVKRRRERIVFAGPALSSTKSRLRTAALELADNMADELSLIHI